MTDLDDLLAAKADKPAPPRRRRKRWPWVVAFSIVGLILVAGGVALTYLWSLANSYSDKVTTLPSDEAFPDPAVRPAAESTGAMNILLLGSDTRDPMSHNIDGIRGQRSDTIMIAHIPADNSGVQIMSIMRDNWVPIPGFNEAKINAALAFGGPRLTVQTIESLIGVRIDHVAIVDFEGFKGLTDALGGVTVDNQVAFTRDGFTYAQGTIALDGDQALGFVRERYSFRDGDYQRARNQQAYIKGVLSAVLNSATLTDPAKIANTVSAISPYLTVDAGLDAGTVGSLGLRMRDLRASDIVFFTSPTLGTGTSADGQSIVLPDWDGLAKVAEAFKTDTVGAYAAQANAGG